MKKFALAWLVLAACGTVANAADWADLKIHFKVNGEVPPVKKLTPDKDQQLCGKVGLVDEKVVAAKDGSLANVFVYLIPPTGKKVEVCPDLKADSEVVLDNEKCRYAPHALVVQTSQTLVLGNKDAIGHNVKGEFLGNGLSFNDLIPATGTQKKTFKKAESLPFPVSCSIHSWMQGYVLVRDDPYAAISDEAGKLTIAKLPVGKHTFAIWHENPGFVSKPVVGGKAMDWKKGRVEIEIKKDGTDFGTVEVVLKKDK